MAREPEWHLLHTFLTAAQQGSLSAAARVLGSTQPTVSRQIQLLEDTLGYTLFSRSLEGLSLTEAGTRLLPGIETMYSAAAQALRSLSDDSLDHAGTVRLTASTVVGAEVIPPVLAELQAAFPNIQIELSLSNKIEDLLRGEADIGIRMIRPTQSNLIAKRLGGVDLRLYAHQHYLEQRGIPQSIDDLKNHALIGFDKDQRYAKVLRQIGLAPEQFSFRSDNELAQLSALRSGCGIGICHTGIARHNAALTPVLSGQIHSSLEMWLTMHQDLRTSSRFLAVFRFLAAKLEMYCRY